MEIGHLAMTVTGRMCVLEKIIYCRDRHEVLVEEYAKVKCTDVI
jgi:hypothetical protein